MAKPNPNKPITHINPPPPVSDRVLPLKPGTFNDTPVPETEANPDKPPPKKKPRK